MSHWFKKGGTNKKSISYYNKIVVERNTSFKIENSSIQYPDFTIFACNFL